MDHLLRGCEFAIDFWQQLQFPVSLRESFNLPLGEWLKVNCKTDIVSMWLGIPWNILFPIGVWHLWLHRNNFVFRSGKLERTYFKKCIMAAAEFFSVGRNAKVPKARIVVEVGWVKPPMGWVKLNTDGSAIGSTGCAGGGGVIRNHEGQWLRGFARPLGSSNSCTAELWALRDGLLLAIEMGLNNIIIEMDALSIVLLMKNNTANLLMEPLLTDCRNLLSKIPNKQIAHIYREANQCADALAKIGASSVGSFVDFLYPPSVVESIIASDKANMCCNRLINI